MNINWYPGHMAKATRELKKSITFVDTVVNILDARVPFSSYNTTLSEIAGEKPVVILLNKCDLAEEKLTNKWIEYYKSLGYYCLAVNALKGDGIARTKDIILISASEKLEKEKLKGRRSRAVRVMVVGMPNVGKSSFINRISGASAAPVGNRPGVTRGQKWIRIGQGIELMDTPGILVPKIDNRLTGLKLAWIGSIKDEILNVEELAIELLSFIWDNYRQNIVSRFGIAPDLISKNDGSGFGDYDDVGSNIMLNYMGNYADNNIDNNKNYNIDNNLDNCSIDKNNVENACLNMGNMNIKGNILLEACARARGCIISGGRIDTNRASVLVLDEFRSGKLGRITLDAWT